MNRHALVIVAVALALCYSCSKEKPAETISVSTENLLTVTDDSTYYGLACDGCTDTIVIVLSDLNRDPDTFNILDASRRHQVFGFPRIGDMLAVVRNASDTTRADMVIDIENLKKSWCFLVTPTLRKRADLTQADMQHLMNELPDSLKEELLKPREYGFTLKSENSVRNIGPRDKNSDEPIEYDRPRRYREWHMRNGQLLLVEAAYDSLGTTSIAHCDTASIVMLRPDTLVLRIDDQERGYYAKKEAGNE